MNDEQCVGVQYPCDKLAMHWLTCWDGDDVETRRPVLLGYCDEHYQEVQQIDGVAYEPGELIW